MTKRVKNKNKNVRHKGNKTEYFQHKARNDHKIEVKNPLFTGFITKEGVSLRLNVKTPNPEDLYLLSEFIQNNVQENKQEEMFSTVEAAFGCKFWFKDRQENEEQRRSRSTVLSIEDFVNERSRND